MKSSPTLVGSISNMSGKWLPFLLLVLLDQLCADFVVSKRLTISSKSKLSSYLGATSKSHVTPKGKREAHALLTVTQDDLQKGLAEGSLTLIDVRSKHALAKSGKFPGSFVVPYSEVENAFMKLPGDEFLVKYGFEKPTPPGSNLVFGCFKNGPGTRIARELMKHGYSEIRCYEGNLKKMIPANRSPKET